MSFMDKVVLITGASTGVGADAALHFSTLSAKLVLVSRNATNLQQTADICQHNSGLTPLSIVADITKDEDVERIMDTTKQHYGKLDVLVNNAGMTVLANIINSNMDKYDEVMNTNLRTLFNLARLATPLLNESAGNIINISSVLGARPMVTALVFSVSKSALNTFTRTIALQLAPKVRVNAVFLGYVETDIRTKSGVERNIRKAIIKILPLGMPVDVQDVPQLIAYLASDAAKNITGHYVALDSDCSVL